MPHSDPRVDAYIQKSPEYARPILTHLRKVVHDACPDVQETIKWGVPNFEHHGILCGIAAFKSDVTFGFWKSQLLADRGFPELGRLRSLADLPSDAELRRTIKAAMALNEEGIQPDRPRRGKKPPIRPPAYFMAAVKKNKKALTRFQAFSPSHKREYVEWVTEAKGEDTRQRRLTQAVAWIAEGKSRNWKYQ
jgi:hypothetical protein